MTFLYRLRFLVIVSAVVSASSIGQAGHLNEEPEVSLDEAGEPVSLTVFPEIVFYDMYAGKVDEPVPDGVLRHDNTLYATQLAGSDLDSLQNTLTMYVWIGALCDNYDRLGGVFLSLVPKGQASYVPKEVTRFEIARFVTPFMDMNRQEEPVSFVFQLDNLVPLLKDAESWSRGCTSRPGDRGASRLA